MKLLKNFSEKNAFTLVELLVVIAIIGLFSVLVLVVLGPVREQSRDAKGESDLRIMMTAFEIKYHDNGQYPDLPDVLADIPTDDTRLSPYLPLTPRTNTSRIYQWHDDGDNQKFCVLFQYEAKSGYFTCSHRGCQVNDSAVCLGF